MLGIGDVKVSTVRFVFTEFIGRRKRRTNGAVTVVCYQCLDGGAKRAMGAPTRALVGQSLYKGRFF